jgi:hypothetical protein
MKRIILKGKVRFTLRDGAAQSTILYEPNRAYEVEDWVAAHPVFADRIAKIEDVKTEPEPVKPVRKRTPRRRNGSHDSSVP